jgi:hypothetical protein
MIVVLCHPDDVATMWLQATWRELGVNDVELVSVEQLVFSRVLVHRLTNAGDSGSVRLADGRTLQLERISGLVNRVRFLPTSHFATADAVDRAYATAELNAFMLGWLNGVAGRVLNPARPFDLGGGMIDRTTVIHFAATAGLPTETWCASSTRHDDDAASWLTTTHAPVVFDGRLFGPIMPHSVQDGCRRLAALLGVPLLQVLLHHSDERGWLLVDAVGHVDFRFGGQPLAAAIAGALAP